MKIKCPSCNWEDDNVVNWVFHVEKHPYKALMNYFHLQEKIHKAIHDETEEGETPNLRRINNNKPIPPEDWRVCMGCKTSVDFNLLNIYNDKGRTERIEIHCSTCDKIEAVIQI